MAKDSRVLLINKETDQPYAVTTNIFAAGQFLNTGMRRIKALCNGETIRYKFKTHWLDTHYLVWAKDYEDEHFVFFHGHSGILL